MVSTKEAGSVSSPQPEETLRGEHNSFLRFIEGNEDLFSNHSSLTHELRDMEEGWKTSPAIDHLVKQAILIGSSLNRGDTKSNRQARRTIDSAIDRAIGKTRDRVMLVIFSNQTEKDKLDSKYTPLWFSAWPHFTPETRKSVQTLEEQLDEFRISFQEERKPIIDSLRKSKTELIEKFRDFLLSDPLGIFMFQEFLLSKESGRRKEEIRPFLSSLIEEEERMHKDGEGSSLSQAVKKWINEIREHPTDIFINKFVASIKDPDILEWLKFAATDTTGLADFLKSRPVAEWPNQLRQSLNSFISSKYQSAHAEIRKELDPFRKPLSSKASRQISEVFEEQVGVASEEKTVPPEKVGLPVEPTEKGEREKHPVGILSREVGKPNYLRSLTKEDLEKFLRKESESLAPSDPRMLKDLQNMIRDLSESPYGVGTKKLHDMNFRIGKTQKFPLRSYNPGKRIGLDLEHPDSKSIRIVFTRSENPNGLSFVGIEGIYTHDDYEKKF